MTFPKAVHHEGIKIVLGVIFDPGVIKVVEPDNVIKIST